jgi:arylformamidase
MTIKVKRVLDLTQFLYHNSPCYPGTAPPRVNLIYKQPSDGWNLEEITIHLHQTTHIDAPYHILDTGPTLDQIGVDRFIATGIPVDLRRKGPREAITVYDLRPVEHNLDASSLVLLVTGWGHKRSWTREWIYESPWLSTKAARWLVEHGVRGVGIDHFSIGGTGDSNEEVHRILLGNNLLVLEDLLLSEELFERDTWMLVFLPLLIRGTSGAPARAVAIEFDG